MPCELSKDPSSGVVTTFFSMPCGNYGSKTTPCRCTPKEISRYLGRISGLLLDRIDIQLKVTALVVKEITETPREESSDAIRERVQAARERQQTRFREEGISCNAQLNARQVEEVCVLDDEGKQTLERACEIMRRPFSGRDREESEYDQTERHSAGRKGLLLLAGHGRCAI